MLQYLNAARLIAIGREVLMVSQNNDPKIIWNNANIVKLSEMYGFKPKQDLFWFSMAQIKLSNNLLSMQSFWNWNHDEIDFVWSSVNYGCYL